MQVCLLLVSRYSENGFAAFKKKIIFEYSKNTRNYFLPTRYLDTKLKLITSE